MAPRDRLHILVRRPAVAEEYTSHAVGRSGPRPPSPIRGEHARRLTEEARQAERQGIARRAATAQQMEVTASGDGLYVTFESWPGFELELKSLDPLRQGPELVAVTARGTQENRVQFATVYVPAGEMSYFFQRLDQYANEDTATGNPRNVNMVERIAVLRLATLREIRTDARESFPRPHDKVWWEVWLRRSDGHEIERLQAFAANTDMVIGSRHLVFDNRVIVLAHATATQLASALNVIDDFAELRAARVSSEFFTALSPAEQADWINDLVNRTEPAPATAPAACILDTGINRGHPLLGHSLSEDDLHTCNLAWGASDHDGHGTQMAGVTLYGDLPAALEDGNRVRLRHFLESVKSWHLRTTPIPTCTEPLPPRPSLVPRCRPQRAAEPSQ